MVAVHGRTREQKDAKQVKADWNAIRVHHLQHCLDLNASCHFHFKRPVDIKDPGADQHAMEYLALECMDSIQLNPQALTCHSWAS